MKRREFITLLGGAAAWPAVVRAQGERVRRIGIMPPGAENDSETQARLAAFRQGLEQLGWREGRNVRFEYRWAQGTPELIKRYAAELVAFAPDLILTGLTPGVQALKRETTTIPILFANVADPVASGLVPSLAKPGGNVTGFTAVEYAIVGKWLELLKELAPNTARVALIGNPEIVFTRSFFRQLESVAPSFGVTPVAAEVRSATEIERAVELLAREPNGGILVVPELTATIHRALIFRLAISNRPSDRLSIPLPGCRRRTCFLRPGSSRPIPRRSPLCGSYSPWHEAVRPSGAGSDQVRIGNQPQDRESARPKSTANAARARRRGDRMTTTVSHRLGIDEQTV